MGYLIFQMIAVHLSIAHGHLNAGYKERLTSIKMNLIDSLGAGI
jgi:hypothetical protein